MFSNLKNIFFGGLIRSRFPVSGEGNGQKVGDMDEVRTVLSNMVYVARGYHIR